MAEATHETLIDNDKVRVIRVTIPPGVTHTAPEGRGDRVIVAIQGGDYHRHENLQFGPITDFATQSTGTLERIRRAPGDAVFREASTHAIKNNRTDSLVSIVVELKQ